MGTQMMGTKDGDPTGRVVAFGAGGGARFGLLGFPEAKLTTVSNPSVAPVYVYGCRCTLSGLAALVTSTTQSVPAGLLLRLV